MTNAQENIVCQGWLNNVAVDISYNFNKVGLNRGR